MGSHGAPRPRGTTRRLSFQGWPTRYSWRALLQPSLLCLSLYQAWGSEQVKPPRSLSLSLSLSLSDSVSVSVSVSDSLSLSLSLCLSLSLSVSLSLSRSLSLSLSLSPNSGAPPLVKGAQKMVLHRLLKHSRMVAFL